MTLQGQVQQAVLAAKAVTSKGSRTALPTLQRAPHSLQAVLAVEAVISKRSRTALPTLQSAPHSFSWAACDFRSKLGDSCDTPGASTGSFGRKSCHL